MSSSTSVGSAGAGPPPRLRPSLERVQRQHDEEVDHRGDDQEVERRGDERRDVEVGALLSTDEFDTETGGARGGNRVDERLNDALGERGDDAAERGANDHGDGEVHDVAAQDEVLETFDHVSEA